VDHLCRRNRHLLALSLSLSLPQSSIWSLKPILYYYSTTTTRTNAYSLVFRRRGKQLPNGLLPGPRSTSCRQQRASWSTLARDSGKRATKRRCNSFRSREQEKGKDGLSDPVFSSRFFFSSYVFFSSRPSCPFTFFFWWPWEEEGCNSNNLFFLSCFFWPHPWPQFFLGTSYLPPPTYLPRFLLPTYLPPSCHWPPSPLTSITRPPKPRRVSTALSFD